MKRVISIVIIVLFVLYSLLPLGIWVTGLIGYSFSLRNYAVSAVGSAIISIMGIVLVCMDRGGEAALPGRVFSLLLLPASLADWICYILLSPWKPTVFCMAVCSACALTYMLKYTQSEIDLFGLQISKKSRNVYSGDWDDWRDMEIYWEDERTLWIDGERFLAD